ncbi:Structural maintenance of chromosomes protein 6, partial [Basidiobolus ranarum]
MGAEAQLGVIESIELVNFMCHRYLKVNLGPKINFIIGHNGSGKSAILSGITVCLGGKATVTNRASNLKSLIREGSSVGQVVVKLRNQGSEAYKPEVYEDCIIIERRISRDGNNGYKIKSSEGKTISTKREELSAICDHMGIQIDNPMNVLSQDTARQFLNSTSPEEKYKFFLRGTQLTQLSEDNEIIRESIDTTENIIRNKKQVNRRLLVKYKCSILIETPSSLQVLPDLLKEAKNAEGRFKDMEQARELRLKVEAMKREIAWAQVVEKEESLHIAETRLYKGQKKLPAIQNELEKENTSFEQINTRISQLEDEKNEHQMALRPLEKRKQEPIEALKEKRRQLQDFQHESQEINGTFKSLRSNLAELEKKIKDETSKLNGDNSNRREEALNKIKALELEIEDAKRGIEESREKHKEYEISNTEAKERYSQIRESIKSIEREVSEFKENIQRLEDQKTNRLKAFGSMMPEILKEVEREGRWKSKPVGPIGAYTKLRKSEWADTMESLVGNLLDCFIVEYHQDRQLLQSILHKYKCPSKIFVSKNDNFDYSAGEPDQRFLTALRVL